MEEFHITPADMPAMETVGTVSSYQPGAERWTTLTVLHRTGFQRPFVAVAEGWAACPYGDSMAASGAPNRFAFKAVAVGTLKRALDWFDDSHLADTLEASCTAWLPPVAATRFYEGDANLGGVLAWLYPGQQDRGGRSIGKALLLSEDFGIAQRTVNSALAAERDGGAVGPWVPLFVNAMRFFDRAAWSTAKEAARG